MTRNGWGESGVAMQRTLTAAILAGGAGTRLRSVVSDRPKPLALVAGRPFLEYVLDQVVTLAPVRIVVCTGHGAGQIEAAVGRCWRGIEVVYSREASALGTGGALANAAAWLEADTTLVMNGDSYCDTPLHEFVEAHCAMQAPASLLLARMPDAARYGAVTLGEDNRIIMFREKGMHAEGWINAGIYLLSRHRLRSIPGVRPVSLEHEMFPQWVAAGLYGYPREARFIDIGVPEDFRAAQTFFDGHSGS